jgi:hypothetical protein
MAVVESVTGDDLTSQKSCPMMYAVGRSSICGCCAINAWKGQEYTGCAIAGMVEADIISGSQFLGRPGWTSLY